MGQILLLLGGMMGHGFLLNEYDSYLQAPDDGPDISRKKGWNRLQLNNKTGTFLTWKTLFSSVIF